MNTSPSDQSKNVKLRELVEATGLKQQEVLDLLNAGQARPVPMSTFKAWIAKPESVRIRIIPDLWMEHAVAVLEQAISEKEAR